MGDLEAPMPCTVARDGQLKYSACQSRSGKQRCCDRDEGIEEDGAIGVGSFECGRI